MKWKDVKNKPTVIILGLFGLIFIGSGNFISGLLLCGLAFYMATKDKGDKE